MTADRPPPGRRAGFGAGLVVGLALGAFAALLLAPDSGRQTRRRLHRGIGRVRERLADDFEEVDDRVRARLKRRR